MEETTPTIVALPEQEPPPKHPLSRLRWAVLLLLGVAVAVAFAVRPQEIWDWLKAHQADLEQRVHEHLLLASLAAFLVYVTVASLSLPFGVWMTVACGVLFGRWLGLGIVSFASAAGATLALLLCRFLFRDYVRERYGPRLEAIDRGIDRSGIYYLLTLRLNPFIPYFLINAALGLTRMPAWTFWIVSQLGMLPLTFIYVSAAAELAHVDRPADLLAPGPLIYLALASLTPLVLRKVFQRDESTLAAGGP